MQGGRPERVRDTRVRILTVRRNDVTSLKAIYTARKDGPFASISWRSPARALPVAGCLYPNGRSPAWIPGPTLFASAANHPVIAPNRILPVTARATPSPENSRARRSPKSFRPPPWSGPSGRLPSTSGSGS